MDSRVKALLGSAVLLLAIVVVVIVGRSDGPEAPDATDLSAKPVIEAPEEAPPTELVSEDIVEGDGAEAKEGDTVEVEYVGVDYETGREFDTSWDPEDQPFSFTIGAGDVIDGWDQGVPGMKVGGRRQLTIPPDLAYGPTGSPPDIAPNATLIFVVDLKRVN